MKTLTLLFLTLPLWAGPPQQQNPPQRLPIDEMDSLADAFDVNKPLAAMDTEDGDMRPHRMDNPIVFRVPVTPQLKQAVTRGLGSVSFPERTKTVGKVISRNRCAIDILNSGGIIKDGFAEFEVEVATWRIYESPLYSKLANSQGPTRTCGAFNSVDTSGVYRVSCSITSCEATVRDFEGLFGPGGVELFTIVTDDDPPAPTPVVGTTSEFEKAKHTTTEKKAPAAGASAVSITPSASSASAATSPSGDASTPPINTAEPIAPGGASLLSR